MLVQWLESYLMIIKVGMVLTQLYFHTMFFEELEITRRIGERSLFYSFLIYPHELSYSTSGPKNGKENYILSRVGKQEKNTAIHHLFFLIFPPWPWIKNCTEFGMAKASDEDDVSDFSYNPGRP